VLRRLVHFIRAETHGDRRRGRCSAGGDSTFPNFWSRRTAEKALPAVIQEAYIKGISTCSMDDLVKAMGMSGVSKSQVPWLRGELEPRYYFEGHVVRDVTTTGRVDKALAAI
jgi:hypothetical protein